SMPRCVNKRCDFLTGVRALDDLLIDQRPKHRDRAANRVRDILQRPAQYAVLLAVMQKAQRIDPYTFFSVLAPTELCVALPVSRIELECWALHTLPASDMA